MELKERVLEVVVSQGPIKARKVASFLSRSGETVTRKDVNRVLHGDKSLFEQNGRFEWTSRQVEG